MSDDLQDMTVPQLRKYCRQSGIKDYARLTTKSELLYLIRQEAECGICLDSKKLATFVTLPGCEHKICFACVINVVRSSSECPYCRQTFCDAPPKTEKKEQLPDELLESVVNESVAHSTARYVEDMFDGRDTTMEEMMQMAARQSASMVRQWYSD